MGSRIERSKESAEEIIDDFAQERGRRLQVNKYLAELANRGLISLTEPSDVLIIDDSGNKTSVIIFSSDVLLKRGDDRGGQIPVNFRQKEVSMEIGEFFDRVRKANPRKFGTR